MLIAVFAVALFGSCKDEKTKKPASSDMAPSENVQNKATQTNSTGDVALNPPHGQPGHRCEIPVGAPLDGSAANNSPVIQTQTKSQSPVINNTGNVPVQSVQSNNTNTATSGNVNPPHGQPGHRCEIPVGAPLD